MRLARCLVASAAILLGLAGVTTAAGAAEVAPPPKCRKAEINPVTGHVLCIDPLGAPVEAPPEEAKPQMQARGRAGPVELPACLHARARRKLSRLPPVYQALSISPETARNGFKTADARCFIAVW